MAAKKKSKKKGPPKKGGKKPFGRKPGFKKVPPQQPIGPGPIGNAMGVSSGNSC